MTQRNHLSASIDLESLIDRLIEQTPAQDIHTHLYDPAFGNLLLWGIDDLLVYHYLVAEAFLHLDIEYDQFWAMTKYAQAELIWEALFVNSSPLSEACRGVLTTLHALGVDPKRSDLPKLRKWFAEWKREDYLDRCMELARVRSVCMTNSPFDDAERGTWERGFVRDERFVSALRLDPLILNWPHAVKRLGAMGYRVDSDFSDKTLSETRRFLVDWTEKTEAQYLMASFPPDFEYPGESAAARVLDAIVLPHCRDFNLPFALMLGVNRNVNRALKLAGDGVGWARLSSLERLCAEHSGNKFMATVLSRENQHELCVLARKFRNLHIFGCWWFSNVPGLVEETTRMRVEMLGCGFTAQHSDARVLDQLIYKWRHARRVIRDVLVEKYSLLAEAGWTASEAEIRRDLQELLGGSFQRFLDA